MITIILLLILLFFVLKSSCLNKENFDFIGNGSPSWYLPKKYMEEDWKPSMVGISGK
tara:strand:+ start:311 stop:481 length:171 start_codon:yes stop_codon:yes gene_type:complete